MSDIDQDLYDRVMAARTGHGDTTHYALGHRHGYEEAAKAAAHISAERQQAQAASDPESWHRGYRAGYKRRQSKSERQPVPVSDEELAVIFADAIEAEHRVSPATTQDQLGQQIIAGIRAVRAAINAAKEDER
jgi:hypothetical protein